MANICFVDAENADFRFLAHQLDEYYISLVGDVHLRYAACNDPRLFACRAVAYADGKAVGCGAWKRVDEETFEVKRIYILPGARRQGIASQIISVLEQDAVKTGGFARAILETARTTADSAALYRKLGYTEIPYYGSPAGAENCRCFEKSMSAESLKTE